MIPRLQSTQAGIGLPRLGRIAKGAKDDRDRPVDLDHFRFVPDVQGDEAEEVLETLRRVYGDRPTVIRAILPHVDPDVVFEAWCEEWGAGGLKHRCDGDNVVLYYDAKAQVYVQPASPMPCPGGCRPVGRLHLIIPELNRLATWTLTTSSVNDIIHISRTLRHAAQALEGIGGLPRVVFQVRRVPRPVYYTNKRGQRVRRMSHLVQVEIDPVSVARAMTALAGQETVAALYGAASPQALVDTGAGPDALDIPAPEVEVDVKDQSDDQDEPPWDRLIEHVEALAQMAADAHAMGADRVDITVPTRDLAWSVATAMVRSSEADLVDAIRRALGRPLQGYDAGGRPAARLEAIRHALRDLAATPPQED